MAPAGFAALACDRILDHVKQASQLMRWAMQQQSPTRAGTLAGLVARSALWRPMTLLVAQGDSTCRTTALASAHAPADRSGGTMSKLARAITVGAMLAAMNLAGMTAVAQAQTNDQDARRPPSQGQVGEAWRQPQATAEQSTIAGDPRRPPTESQVGESWRHQSDVPAQPVEPGGLPSWVMASLGLLAAVLALAGGLAVLAARRAGRRARVGHAA
jgi:hypothetical protein